MSSFSALALGAVLGALVGHGIRRAVPWLLRLRDRRLPFGGPWVETATAFGFAFVAWRFAFVASSIGLFAFVALLVAIAATDYRSKLIPDRLTLGGLGIGIVAAATWPARLLDSPIHAWFLDAVGLGAVGLDARGPVAGVILSIAGALLGFVILESIRLGFGAAVGTDVMGMGDSKLLAMIGAFLGPVGVLASMLLAFFYGVVHGVAVLKLSGQPHSPFGPPLAAAAVTVLVASDSLLRLVAGFQRLVLSLPLAVLASLYTALLVLAVFLVWRTRRRAAEYEEILEADYRRVEDELED